MFQFRRSFYLSLVGVVFVPVTLPAVPTFTEIKKLQADDGQAGDHFGGVVAISGDTAVVSATFEDSGGTDAGAAYIFQRDEGGKNNWGQVRKLQPADLEPGSRFGRGAISGNTVVVGAFGTGAAYIFQRNEGGENNWGQVKKLQPADVQADDGFGALTVISGGTVVVGAFGEDTGGFNAGAAYVFRRNQGGENNWGQVKKLLAADAAPGDEFGLHIAISGDTAVISARESDTAGFAAGAAYVFRRNKGGKDNWGQVQKLLAADAQAGDRFSIAVAISGDTAVIGAFGEDSGGLDAGASYIFQRHEGGKNNWGQVQKLRAGKRQTKDEFGVAAAISGGTGVVGAQGAGATDAGAAYVFKRDRGGKSNWGQVQKLRAGDAQAGDRFGSAAAMSGDTAVIGAYLADTGGADSGAAYVFSSPGIFDASGDAPPAIDSILADSRQGGSELICTLAIASGNQGLNPKSRFRCHIGFGNLGFAANTTLTYLVKKSRRRCSGIPSLVCSEEEVDLGGTTDAKCDGEIAGDPATACFITLRGDVQDISDQWLTACTESDCLTPFTGTNTIGQYDVYSFWSTKRKNNLDRVPDTDDNLSPDSNDEVVLTTLED